MARILHMSGAGEAIDSAIEGMGGAMSSGPVATGDDFYESLLLKESAMSMFSTAQKVMKCLGCCSNFGGHRDDLTTNGINRPWILKRIECKVINIRKAADDASISISLQ